MSCHVMLCYVMFPTAPGPPRLYFCIFGLVFVSAFFLVWSGLLTPSQRRFKEHIYGLCDVLCFWVTQQASLAIPEDPYVCHMNGNIYHQYTPNVSIYIYTINIRILLE